MNETEFTASLSNCPFCDARPSVKYIGNEHTRKRKIELKCSNAFCRTSMTNAAINHGFDWLEDVSAKAWNRRA